MLTRIRIEVEGEDSAAATEEALTKYEHAIQVAEADRYGALRMGGCLGEEPAEHAEDGPPIHLAAAARCAPAWKVPTVGRGFYNEELGREVTDEVIEYDPSLPGYKGRRVVQFRRLDTRRPALDHHREDCKSNSIDMPSTEASSSGSVVITGKAP